MALISIGLAVSACGAPGSSGSAETGTLRVALGGEPPTLDPTMAVDSVSGQVLRSVTYPLAYFDKDLEVVPGLAAGWEISQNSKTITFHLRDGLKYSNGEPILADDFVHSWKRLIDPREAAPYAYVMADIQGGTELLQADPETDDVDALLDAFGVSAPDPKAFVVNLAHPASYFVYIATLVVTVPTKTGFTFTEADGYASSGPMMLTEWRHDSRIVLEPNPYWAGEAPRLGRIEMPVISDPAAALAAYEAGEIDIASVPSAEIARVRDDPTLGPQVLQGSELSIEYYGFDLTNPDGPFTTSVLLRKAFNEAVDKETMIQVTFGGTGRPAWSLVPPGMPGHQQDEFIPYDVQQARADFNQALSDLGMTKADLDLQIGFNTAGDHQRKVEFLQEQWRTAFGIAVEPVALEFGAYLERLGSDPFDIFRLGWSSDYPHPNNFLTDLVSCASANDLMGYCNTEVDALLAQAAVTPELADQIPLYERAQALIMQDAPIIPIRFGQRFSVVQPWVRNLIPTAQDADVGVNFYYLISIDSH